MQTQYRHAAMCCLLGHRGVLTEPRLNAHRTALVLFCGMPENLEGGLRLSNVCTCNEGAQGGGGGMVECDGGWQIKGEQRGQGVAQLHSA